jgi:Peptidase A4 family
MIAAGLMRAVARRPIWPLAIAGVAAAPMFLAAPALAAPGSVLAGSATGTQVTNCGGGVSAVTVRPAAGFHPLTATPAQLTANGLPLRPTGRTELAAWRKFVTGGVRAARTTCGFAAVTPSSAPRSIVGNAKPGSLVGDAKPGSLVGDAKPGSLVGDAKPGSLVGDAKPGSLVGDAKPGSLVGDAKPGSLVGDAKPASMVRDAKPPATAPRPSPGGNRATAVTRTVVYGTWRVTRPKNAPTAAACSWAGIGSGRAGDPLIQAGSSAGGYFGPYLWWRMVPQRPNEQRISLDAAAGDTVYVRIQLRSAVATVIIRDENTGAGGMYRLRY